MIGVMIGVLNYFIIKNVLAGFDGEETLSSFDSGDK